MSASIHLHRQALAHRLPYQTGTSQPTGDYLVLLASLHIELTQGQGGLRVAAGNKVQGIRD
jgi:hypothetical protein